jgi:hypothetical protein
MVFDLISFSAGVYFGFRHCKEEKWALIEKAVPYGFGISAGLTLLASIIFKNTESFVIEALAYFFLAFTLGTIAGNIAGKRLKRASEAD